MMKRMLELSEEVVETLSADERMICVLLYAERLRVAEVSEVLEIPPERVIAIAAFVRYRVRMAITGGLRSRAVSLWEQSHESRPAATSIRRLSQRTATIERRKMATIQRHRRAEHS